MKLSEVSVGQAGRESFALDHVRWYRGQAAKYEITIDGSGNGAHDGLPRVRREMSWFGGTFLPKGGWKKEEDSMRIPLAKRAKFFLKDLVHELQKYAGEGRHIYVSRNTGANLSWPSCDIDEIEEKLFRLSDVNDSGKEIRVLWAISNLND
jgi:hypothetical protein